jgi:hypothetical protein
MARIKQKGWRLFWHGENDQKFMSQQRTGKPGEPIFKIDRTA